MAWPLSLPEGVGACWEILAIFLFFPGLVLAQQLCRPARSPGDPHHPPTRLPAFSDLPILQSLPLVVMTRVSNLLLS